MNFTDDDNHDEELTSAAYPASGTVAAPPNLTVGSPSVTNNNPEPGEVKRGGKASPTEWRDITGRKRDKISLTNTKNQLITEPKSVVFYTLAHDLVRAFLDFGYQLFEPNVRCEIKNSKVNRAIKASVRSARGRREFKHLNNGITMICAGSQKGDTDSSYSAWHYQWPSDGKSDVRCL